MKAEVVVVKVTPMAGVFVDKANANRLSEMGGSVLGDFLADSAFEATPTPQNEAGALHAAKLVKAEGKVDWQDEVQKVHNHVRGMDPWPGAFTLRGDKVLKMFSSQVSELSTSTEAQPGEVVTVDGEGIHVACGQGVLCIAEVQAPGKKRMLAQSYAAGHPFQKGDILA